MCTGLCTVIMQSVSTVHRTILLVLGDLDSTRLGLLMELKEFVLGRFSRGVEGLVEVLSINMIFPTLHESISGMYFESNKSLELRLDGGSSESNEPFSRTVKIIFPKSTSNLSPGVTIEENSLLLHQSV